MFCLDSILYLFTILPIRVGFAWFTVWKDIVWHRRLRCVAHELVGPNLADVGESAQAIADISDPGYSQDAASHHPDSRTVVYHGHKQDVSHSSRTGHHQALCDLQCARGKSETVNLPGF
jgi:hypothetical protein